MKVSMGPPSSPTIDSLIIDNLKSGGIRVWEFKSMTQCTSSKSLRKKGRSIRFLHPQAVSGVPVQEVDRDIHGPGAGHGTRNESLSYVHLVGP